MADADKVKEETHRRTTIVYRFIHHQEVNGDGEGPTTGGGGSGPSVGATVDGGGVVVDVSGSTVTVQFPDGIPTGPIRLPGTDTTVVVEEGPTDGNRVVVAPWGPGEQVVEPGLAGSLPDEGRLSFSGQERSFRLPCPGSRANTVPLPEVFLLSPSSSGTCPCVIFLGSMDAGGRLVGTPVILDPGQHLPFYQLEKGASKVVAACSGGCPGRRCFAQLTVQRGKA
jgi:hypothetical protein